MSQKSQCLNFSAILFARIIYISARIKLKYKPERCGGVILNKRLIATAAHCVLTFFGVNVRVGNSDAADGVKKRITRYFRSGRNKDAQFDIALIQLEEGLSFNDQILPIEMIKSDKDIAEYSKVKFRGYGDIHIM